MTRSKAGAADGILDSGGWFAERILDVRDRPEAAIKHLEQWLVAEQKRVYLLCLRMLRNRDEADSATQDTFLKAYRVLERADPPEIKAPAKWLTRVAVNTCLDRLRSKRLRFWSRRSQNLDEVAVLQLAPASGLSPEESVLAQDISRRLAAALDRLSLKQRSVFVLRHEEDHSIEEIAEIMGLDQGTVKSHMARALKKLREELSDLYGKPALE
jgi:RNA polymerase sigma-70 factor (ECF subfamily)